MPEPARKKVRFAERVETRGFCDCDSTEHQQQFQQQFSSSSSSSPTAIATSMQVDESDQDRSKRQKVVHGTDMELEELVMEAELDRLQRYADRSFLAQARQDTDSTLTKLLPDCKERSCEEGVVAVRCAFTSSRGRCVFKSWKNLFCPQAWSHPWIGVGFADRMGLE